MSQFNVYKSTDASAPTLTGQTGSLISLLHAILVAGYGSKSGAGWSEPFTNTSTLGVWQLGAGTGRYLRVDDSGSLTGGFRDTSVRGFETMSDINTGLCAFPNVSIAANGVNWRKSSTADSTARAWTAFADNRTLHFFLTNTGDGSLGSGSYAWYSFGDFYSYFRNDAYNCMLLGCEGSSTGSENFNSNSFYWGDVLFTGMQSGPTSGMVGHYINRAAAGSPSSVKFAMKGCNQLTNAAGNSINPALNGILDFPNGSDNSVWLHPMWIMDGVTPDVIHGEVRGMYHCVHPITFFGDGDTYTGAGAGIGRTVQIFRQTPSAGLWVVETSDTLPTN